jgi:hypothetical protein
MSTRHRLGVIGCATAAVVAVAAIPAMADPGAGGGRIDAGTTAQLRTELSQLRLLDQQQTMLVRDRLDGDVRSGTVPLRAAEAPAFDKTVAFGLPDGRTVAAAPAAAAAGDTLAVMYDSAGRISQRVEVRTVAGPDASFDTTTWVNDAEPVPENLSAAQLLAVKQALLGPGCWTALAALAGVPLVWLGAAILTAFFAPFVLIPIVALLVFLVDFGTLNLTVAAPVVTLVLCLLA